MAIITHDGVVLQVVSADTANNVVVWDAETGAVASQFEIDDDGDSARNALTAMTFDSGGRRLVTGTHKVRLLRRELAQHLT